MAPQAHSVRGEAAGPELSAIAQRESDAEWLRIESISDVLQVHRSNALRLLSSAPSVVTRKVKEGRAWRVEYALATLPPEVLLALRSAAGPGASPESHIGSVEASEIAPDDPGLARVNDRVRRVIRVTRAAEQAPARGRTALIAKLCQREGITRSTFYRLSARIEREGATNLLQPRDLKGKHHSLTPEAMAFLASFYCQPCQPTRVLAFEAYAAEASAKGWEKVHYRTVCRFLDELPAATLAMTRQGPETWLKSYAPVLRRDPLQDEPGAVWYGDGRIFDVMVQDPEYPGKFFRPEVVHWMDSGSRKIAGYVLTKTLTSEAVAEALISDWREIPGQPGMLVGVRPKKLYIDNGKEYKNRHITGYVSKSRLALGHRAVGIIQAWGIEVTHALPYNARAKVIERLHRTMSLRFDRCQPGWCGPDPTKKPERLKRLLKSGKVQTWAEFVAAYATWVRWYNEVYVHGATKRTPDELYAKVPREKVRRESLRALVLKHGIALVHQDGIHIWKDRYWHSDLGPAIGEKVQLRWDPADLATITVEWRGKWFQVPGAKYFSSHPSEADYRKWRRELRDTEKQVKAGREAYGKLVDPLPGFAHLRERPPMALPAAAGEATHLVTLYDRVASQQSEAEARSKAHGDALGRFAQLPPKAEPERRPSLLSLLEVEPPIKKGRRAGGRRPSEADGAAAIRFPLLKPEE